MSKAKILLVADVPGWAFDVNLRDMARYLPEFEFGHAYYADNMELSSKWTWDAVYLCMHQWIKSFTYSRILGSLRSRWFDPRFLPGLDARTRGILSRCSAFHAVTAEAYDVIRHEPNTYYLTNPVNMERFQRPTEVKDIVACWAGNAYHANQVTRNVKGFWDVVAPACSRAGKVLRYAEYNTCRIPTESMPELYCQASVYLCASDYEGASNSVMEAMASGLALITTDVGNHREMRDSQLKAFGDTGIIFAKKSRDSFVGVLSKLTPKRVREMGRINRAEIAARWSWEAWRDRYVEYMGKAVA